MGKYKKWFKIDFKKSFLVEKIFFRNFIKTIDIIEILCYNSYRKLRREVLKYEICRF